MSDVVQGSQHVINENEIPDDPGIIEGSRESTFVLVKPTQILMVEELILTRTDRALDAGITLVCSRVRADTVTVIGLTSSG